ncbi:hypothetical protein CTAYLR_004780 [Chrysophaeum taylorii]|uniref:Tox-ART-HYD1 domain-containing protein n=1 Tax=Chrysophaeum taylorii TaxID=2483200 RepID=A0AAD7XRE7_9STRA|nr:hypothetical protein CTAYLR_004780 [Chrysophaeum taylorii]
MYTSRGDRIRNPSAYTAAGGRAFSSNGSGIRDPTAYQRAIDASVRQNSDSPVYLYHYTDPGSAAKIENSGMIKASSDGALGSGTYLTAKPPRTSSDRLMTNNYDGAASTRDASKVDSYVRVDAARVQAENGRAATSRDVWKVDGDVKLADAGAKIGSRSNKRKR